MTTTTPTLTAPTATHYIVAEAEAMVAELNARMASPGFTGETALDAEPSLDECDQCCSHTVVYPYTTLGYLCGSCRDGYAGTFKNIQ
jgi:hypothetical protein